MLRKAWCRRWESVLACGFAAALTASLPGATPDAELAAAQRSPEAALVAVEGPAGNAHVDGNSKANTGGKVKWKKVPLRARQTLNRIDRRMETEKVKRERDEYEVRIRQTKPKLDVRVRQDGMLSRLEYKSKDGWEKPIDGIEAGSAKPLPLAQVAGTVKRIVSRVMAGATLQSAWEVRTHAGRRIFLLTVKGEDRRVLGFTRKGNLRTCGLAHEMLAERRDVRPPAGQSYADVLAEKRGQVGVSAVLARIASKPFSPAKGLRFAVIGDPQNNIAVFSQIMAHVARQDVQFVALVGDLVMEGTASEYLEYYLPVVERYPDVPVLPIVGNRDVTENFAALAFRHLFGDEAVAYKLDYGNCRFVFLDNCSRSIPWKTQLARADTWLAEASENMLRKFVFVHKPPTRVAQWAYHADTPSRSQQFTELMTQHEVDHVFMGHIHAYSTAEHDGVDYTVTGGGGGKLHQQFGPLGSVRQYVLVEVKGEQIRQRVVRFFPPGAVPAGATTTP